jgi:hypothetical protein
MSRARARTVSREYDDKFEDGASEVDLENKNVNWLSMSWTKPSYVLFIYLFNSLLVMSNFFPIKDCWTVTNIVHAVITFLLFHWIKGSPDAMSQGAYNGLTLYEQMEAGVPWTATKKFLMLVPTAMLLLACNSTDYEPTHVVVNCGIFLLLIIPKIPDMHRVRILGINSTPGIDDNMGYTPPRQSRDNSKSQ